MASSWRLVPGQALLHRGWDGACVLYNDLSGDTHLLSAEALDLLLALRDGDVAPDELALPEVAELLAALQGLELVEPCPVNAVNAGPAIAPAHSCSLPGTAVSRVPCATLP